VVTAGRVGHDRRRRRVTGWYRVSDPNRGDHLAMAAARNGAAVSRGNGPPNSGVRPSPGEVSESPSRFNATEHAELKENRRSDVDPNPPTASRKRAHKVELRLQGRAPYSSISRGEIRCQDPLSSWPASCRPPRQWAAADRQATYRRVGKRYSDLVGVMRPIRIVQWRARCSAKAEGLPTPDCLHDFVDALAQHTIPSG
jgi:hypothetical protein